MSLNLLKNNNFETINLLDWQFIINDISILAHFEVTKNNLALPIIPKSRTEIEYEYDSLSYFIDNRHEFSQEILNILYQTPWERKIFSTIDGLEKGIIASVSELNFICIILETYEQLKQKLKSWNKLPKYELESETFSFLKKKFILPLRKFVSSDGKVHYHKHPVLNELYQKVLNIEKVLRDDINRTLKSPLYSNALQFGEYDIIHDRYVVAISSDSYQGKHGPIIARSASGQTLFVEPPLLKQRANERVMFLAQIEEVINKICVDFSSLLHGYYPKLVLAKDFVLEVDLVNAKALYCQKNELTRPVVSSSYEIELYGLFHPLIENPVKNNVVINENKKGLVISGPNTGGKTVTLKSIALCHLFLHFGVFIPVSKGIIHPVPNIYYFGNDQQSLSDGLSSFASEAKNYLSMISELSADTLIIVDEIFNSTSSEEASALAISLLEEIHKLAKAKVIISTHHQVFKTLIHDNESYISSHVGYDEKFNKPTYKIYIGEPGSSMAFSIFENIAAQSVISTDIPHKAQKLLDKKHVSYEKLLQNLSAKKAHLDNLLRENKELNLELKNQKKSMEGVLLLEKQKSFEKFQDKIEKALKSAKNLLTSVKKGSVSKKEFSREQEKIFSAVKHEKIDLYQPSEVDDQYEILDTLPHLNQIKINETYYSTILKRPVKVTKMNIRKAEVEILHKKVSMKCSVKTLRFLKNTPPTPKTSVKVRIDREPRRNLEIDGRGMRLDDFQHLVEGHLPELLTNEIPFLVVVHGHGDGVLKKWLRDYIKHSKEFYWEAVEGNDGATKIINSK